MARLSEPIDAPPTALREHSDLAERVTRPGFTPGARDLERLLDLLSQPDEELAKCTVRAIAQMGPKAARAARGRFEGSTPPARARIVSALTRIGSRSTEPGLVAFLVDCTRDGDRKTRQYALSALGKLGSLEAVPVLTKALLEAATVLERKAAAEALGRVGGRTEMEILRSLVEKKSAADENQELIRVAREALVRIERSVIRAQTVSTIDLSRTPGRPIRVLLHVRAGLEGLLLSELDQRFGRESAPGAPSKERPSKVGRGRVAIDLDDSLERLFAARLFLHLGFPLPPVHTADLDEGVVQALTSDACVEILRMLTIGPIRYRIEWAGHGHRRSATYRVAEAVAQARPELVNDPKSATWQVTANHRAGSVWVEVWPQAFDDPRFRYRVEAVPGASHPTIAAALARLGGVQASDVVWDPFAGGAIELIERAKLGPCRALYGSDISETALAAARSNLAAGNVQATLFRGDARSDRPPEKVTLVITNPPLGRRVRPNGSVEPLLGSALTNLRRALAPHGRIAWIAPHASRDLDHARQAGLVPEQRLRVDLGGFDAEMQLLRAAPR